MVGKKEMEETTTTTTTINDDGSKTTTTKVVKRSVPSTTTGGNEWNGITTHKGIDRVGVNPQWSGRLRPQVAVAARSSKQMGPNRWSAGPQAERLGARAPSGTRE